MAKETLAEKRVKFAVEEIILSFVGALILTFGIFITMSAFLVSGVAWANLLLGIFTLWLGLLVFTVPMIRKIEQLM